MYWAENPAESRRIMSCAWQFFIWSVLLASLLLCRSAWMMECHREEEFVKVEGALPAISPIKTTTTVARAFCTTECIEYPGCNSFAYLTATDTNNCLLSASSEGESTTAASVVYKREPSKSAGCASGPCGNGATCESTCLEPFYVCHCPSHKQGENCEYDLTCVTEDWELKFDVAGTHVCDATTSFMAGFGRSCNDELHCFNRATCCPMPLKYSHEDMTCTNADGWATGFRSQNWNYCPDGHFLTGLYRGSEENIYAIEWGVCCKPSSAPNHWGDCYTESIKLSFDTDGALVGCAQPLHYIVGIYTYGCNKLSCFEELRCCRIADG